MRALVAILSILGTWVMFYEYLPPWKTVHFFGDIEGYHYPLYSYAQKAFYDGEFPQWDNCVYSGISYAGNPQAALFYPPNWILYYFNRHHPGVSYWTLEALEIAHYWIAFILAWLWLRSTLRTETAALLGATVFAFGGYHVEEVQHVGVILGLAWYPLGLWGISSAAREGSWRPLWKTAAASALCLLAGYPPSWSVFNVCCVAYALAMGGWRVALRTLAALGFSLLLAMVQLAPILEAAALKIKDPTYGGGGLPGGAFFYLQFLMPNFYDQSQAAERFPPPQETYLYLGAPVLVGILCLLVHRVWRPALPGLAVLAAGLLLLFNPGYILSPVMRMFPTLGEAFHNWNFIGALSLGGVMLAAAGIDAVMPRTDRWLAWAAPAAAFLWGVRQWIVWLHGANFAHGWATMAEAAVTAVILYALLCAPRRGLAMAAILLTAGLELKVYGTGRRFNAAPGQIDISFAKDARRGGLEFLGVDNKVFEQLRRNVDYRVVSDGGPHGTELRFVGLSTPAGFDPFLPQQYKDAVERFTHFETNREFRFDWANDQMMDAFAVRYVISNENVPAYAKLKADTRFQLMEPSDGFYKVFEYLAARPIQRFDAGIAQRTIWTPERRVFRVKSDEGGAFELLEQHFPGWRAYIDGKQTPIERVRMTFQGIRVPPGAHTVEFRYNPISVRAGAAVSIAALLAMCAAGWRRRNGAAIR